MPGWKKGKHSEHMVFIMVIAHAGIALWHHFHPWVTKNMDLETVSHFATPNHRKSQNCTQSGCQEASQIHPKIDKADIWASECPLGVPLDPRIVKMLPQVPKRRKVSKRRILD